MFKKMVLILSCWMMIASSVHAEEYDAFIMLDADGDGKIVKEEGPLAFRWKTGMFEIRDVNRDGGITREEYMGWEQAPRTLKLAEKLSRKTFDAIDTNSDGQIHARDEWIGTADQFRAKDKNGDGYIAREESRKK